MHESHKTEITVEHCQKRKAPSTYKLYSITMLLMFPDPNPQRITIARSAQVMPDITKKISWIVEKVLLQYSRVFTSTLTFHILTFHVLQITLMS